MCLVLLIESWSLELLSVMKMRIMNMLGSTTSDVQLSRFIDELFAVQAVLQEDFCVPIAAVVDNLVPIAVQWLTCLLLSQALDALGCLEHLKTG